MKKEKKNNNIKLYLLIAIVLVVLIVVAVLFKDKIIKNNTPQSLTEEYLEEYIKNDESVVNEIVYPFDDELSDLQKERFVGIMKNKYEKISYNIDDTETVLNETDANVVVTVNSIDIKSAYEKATTYIESHQEEFATKEKEIEYKLDAISKAEDMEMYKITFNFYKEDEKWQMNELAAVDVDRIKGLF